MLSVKLDLSSEDANMSEKEVTKMNTFIQTHGARQLGPLIQYTGVKINEEN